ncbi:hypothetical protein JGI25_00648, partial [Candidatus Kryptobacter tengchongensis]
MRNKLAFNVSSLGNCPFIFVLLLIAQIVSSQSISDFRIVSNTGDELVVEYT